MHVTCAYACACARGARVCACAQGWVGGGVTGIAREGMFVDIVVCWMQTNLTACTSPRGKLGGAGWCRGVWQLATTVATCTERGGGADSYKGGLR